MESNMAKNYLEQLNSSRSDVKEKQIRQQPRRAEIVYLDISGLKPPWDLVVPVHTYSMDGSTDWLVDG